MAESFLVSLLYQSYPLDYEQLGLGNKTEDRRKGEQEERREVTGHGHWIDLG